VKACSKLAIGFPSTGSRDNPSEWGLASLPWLPFRSNTMLYGAFNPRREDKLAPGPIARPVLVLDVRINTDNESGALLVAYGTGEFDPAIHGEIDLIIEDWEEVRALGLHKPTRFSINPRSRMFLPWCAEYFVSPTYVAEAGIYAGSLSQAQQARLVACFQRRGISIP
jgi:hypothetical protein